jgi:CubicO group peptidase (beta-lactamase class C family)
LEGRYNGQQIVPKSVVHDIRKGGDRAPLRPPATPHCPDGAIGTCGGSRTTNTVAFTARGIHGQGIYIDPAAEMLIVRFASHPLAGNVNLDPTPLPAYEAVARHLMGVRR